MLLRWLLWPLRVRARRQASGAMPGGWAAYPVRRAAWRRIGRLLRW